MEWVIIAVLAFLFLSRGGFAVNVSGSPTPNSTGSSLSGTLGTTAAPPSTYSTGGSGTSPVQAPVIPVQAPTQPGGGLRIAGPFRPTTGGPIFAKFPNPNAPGSNPTNPNPTSGSPAGTAPATPTTPVTFHAPVITKTIAMRQPEVAAPFWSKTNLQ